MASKLITFCQTWPSIFARTKAPFDSTLWTTNNPCQLRANFPLYSTSWGKWVSTWRPCKHINVLSVVNHFQMDTDSGFSNWIIISQVYCLCLILVWILIIFKLSYVLGKVFGHYTFLIIFFTFIFIDLTWFAVFATCHDISRFRFVFTEKHNQSTLLNGKFGEQFIKIR